MRYLLTEPNANPGGTWRRLYSAIDGDLYENTGLISRFFVPRLARRVAAADWESELSASTDFHQVPIVHGRGLPPVIANPAGAVLTERVVSPTQFRLRVVTAAPTFVASSQPAMRWWTVRVNGQASPIVRVNGAFIGFFVPAGSSEAVIRYRPWSFWVAVAVAGLGAVLLVWRASRIVE